MNLEKHIAIAAAITLSLGLTGARAVQADAPAQSMAPMQGTTLDLGGVRGVTYFLSENGQCKLVMTLAADLEADAPGFTATRFETTIDAGETTRYVSDKGGAVDFDCEPSAHTINIRRVEEPAGSVAVR